MTPLWLLAHGLCCPAPWDAFLHSPTQTQGNAATSRRVPLDPSPQDTNRRQPPWALRGPAYSPTACPSAVKGPRTEDRKAPGSGPHGSRATSLILFSALCQPGPLHPDGGLALGPSATLHLVDLLTSTLQRLSVPTYRPASPTAEATGHQPPCHLRLDLDGPRAGGTDRAAEGLPRGHRSGGGDLAGRGPLPR